MSSYLLPIDLNRQDPSSSQNNKADSRISQSNNVYSRRISKKQNSLCLYSGKENINIQNSCQELIVSSKFRTQKAINQVQNLNELVGNRNVKYVDQKRNLSQDCPSVYSNAVRKDQIFYSNYIINTNLATTNQAFSANLIFQNSNQRIERNSIRSKSDDKSSKKRNIISQLIFKGKPECTRKRQSSEDLVLHRKGQFQKKNTFQADMKKVSDTKAMYKDSEQTKGKNQHLNEQNQHQNQQTKDILNSKHSSIKNQIKQAWNDYPTNNRITFGFPSQNKLGSNVYSQIEEKNNVSCIFVKDQSNNRIRQLEQLFKIFKCNHWLNNPQSKEKIDILRQNLENTIQQIKNLGQYFNDQIKTFVFTAKKNIQIVLETFQENHYNQKITELRNNFHNKDFIQHHLEILQEYPNIQYLNIDFPLNASQLMLTQLKLMIPLFKEQWNQGFKKLKDHFSFDNLQQHSKDQVQKRQIFHKEASCIKYNSLISLLIPRLSQTICFSSYFRSQEYNVGTNGKTLFNPIQKLPHGICLIEKKFTPGSSIYLQMIDIIGDVKIGLIQLQHASKLKYKNCSYNSIYLNSCGQLNYFLQNKSLLRKPLQFKSGDIIKICLTNDYKLYFSKKNNQKGKSQLISLKKIYQNKNNKVNLYPYIQMQYSSIVKLIRQ